MYSWENTVDPAGCNAGRDRCTYYFLNIFYARGDKVKIEVTFTHSCFIYFFRYEQTSRDPARTPMQV